MAPLEFWLHRIPVVKPCSGPILHSPSLLHLSACSIRATFLVIVLFIRIIPFLVAELDEVSKMGGRSRRGLLWLNCSHFAIRSLRPYQASRCSNDSSRNIGTNHLLRPLGFGNQGVERASGKTLSE